MDKKIIIAVIASVIIAGGGGFYGGMKFAQSKPPSLNFINAQGGGQRQQQGGAQGTVRNRPGGAQGGGFISGTVLGKDDKSITVKLRDNSTKIVFYSGSTSVGKAVAGTAGDLADGQQVTVAGTANPDGSITAQQIQIRPEQAPLPGGAQGN